MPKFFKYDNDSGVISIWFGGYGVHIWRGDSKRNIGPRIEFDRCKDWREPIQ